MMSRYNARNNERADSDRQLTGRKKKRKAFKRISREQLVAALVQSREDGDSHELDPYQGAIRSLQRARREYDGIHTEGKWHQPGGSFSPSTNRLKTRAGFVCQWTDSSSQVHASATAKFDHPEIRLPSELSRINFLVGRVVRECNMPVAHALKNMIGHPDVGGMLRLITPLDLIPRDIPENLSRRWQTDEGWVLVGCALGRVFEGTPKLQLGGLNQPRDVPEARKMLLTWLGYVRRFFWADRVMTKAEKDRELHHCAFIWESEDTPELSEDDANDEESESLLRARGGEVPHAAVASEPPASSSSSSISSSSNSAISS